MKPLVLYGTAVALAVALGATGASAQARQPTDPCALLTQAEAEAILGQPAAPPAKGGASQCTYPTQSGRGEIMLHLIPLQFKSKEEFHAYLVKETENTNARIKKGLEKTGATFKEITVDPVPEVGSPAYYMDPQLVVLKDGRVLGILAGDRAQAVAVAAKALPRF